MYSEKLCLKTNITEANKRSYQKLAIMCHCLTVEKETSGSSFIVLIFGGFGVLGNRYVSLDFCTM